MESFLWKNGVGVGGGTSRDYYPNARPAAAPWPRSHAMTFDAASWEVAARPGLDATICLALRRTCRALTWTYP
eukprot:11192572-Lingulodinium_polyedra.AAC.1